MAILLLLLLSSVFAQFEEHKGKCMQRKKEQNNHQYQADGLKTREECEEICLTREGCVAYEYKPVEQRCDIHARWVDGGDEAEDTFCFIMQPTKWCSISSDKYPHGGTPMLKTKTETPELCKAECEKYAECNGYIWDNTKTFCWPYTNVPAVKNMPSGYVGKRLFHVKLCGTGGCVGDEDCTSGSICWKEHCKPGPDTETTEQGGCTTNADCPLDEHCDQKECKTNTTPAPECETDTDCDENQKCHQGQCIDKGDEGDPCFNDDDDFCLEPLFCNSDGECAKEGTCADTVDCKQYYKCENEVCVWDGKTDQCDVQKCTAGFVEDQLCQCHYGCHKPATEDQADDNCCADYTDSLCKRNDGEDCTTHANCFSGFCYKSGKCGKRGTCGTDADCPYNEKCVAGKYSWEDHKCSPVCTVKTGGGDCYGYDGFPVSKNTNVHRGQKYNIRDEYYKNTYNVGADGYGVSCIIVSGSSNCRITFYNSRGSRACTIGPGTHDYPSVGGCGNDNVWSYELKTAAAADEALGEAEAFQEPTAEAAFSDSLAVKALAVVGGVASLYLLHQAYTKKNAEYSPV